jgi:Sec-independent protein translocase protein TatA
MSGSDLVLVVVAGTAVLAAAILGAATVWFVASVRAIRQAADELTEEVERSLAELRAAIGRADEDLERADSLIGALEEVNERVDAASDLALETFSRPVIRAVSLGSGTARAARRLRRRERAGDPGPPIHREEH